MQRLNIRTLLLLITGGLTLLIVVLAARQSYLEWERLHTIHSLRQASEVGDLLFEAMGKLSTERDIAVAALYASGKEAIQLRAVQLQENREKADYFLITALHDLKRYDFAGLEPLRHQSEALITGLNALRQQVDRNLLLPRRERDTTLPTRWFGHTTVLITQTQELWMEFIRHFTSIDAGVALHVRFKHMIRNIVDYRGRSQALIGRLIAADLPPSPEEQAQLLDWQGKVDLSWKLAHAIADQGELHTAIARALKEAENHFFIVQNKVREMFYRPGQLPEMPYPISLEQWFGMTAEATDSLYALREAMLRETQRYIGSLERDARRMLMIHLAILLAALCISGCSLWVILRRVIKPIHDIVDALLGASKGAFVPLAPEMLLRKDEIGKLAQVLEAFQHNVESLRQTSAELEHSGNKLRAVVDNALDGLIAINERGIIESFNPACERIFGYKAKEVIGSNVKMLMPEPYHSEHDGYIARYMTTGEARIIGTAGREVRARRKDGSIFPIDLSISQFELADGRHFSGIIRDITVRKQAEENLQRYMRDLERSNRELDDFAYIASHDLKEPLRGVHNHSRFLLEDNETRLDEESASRLHRLIYLSQRMERLVNDLLYFSRLGRQEIAVQPTDMNAVVHDIETTIELLLEERRARILVPQPLPVVTCDRTRITEALRNLITNAIKYNDKPEKTVEIGFLPNHALPGGRRVSNVFYVRDNGIGIAPEFHEDVFRIFKRLQASKDKKEEGTGVGLTFVKKIIERHGGRIWLESVPGDGTTFYFTLQGEYHDHNTRQAA